MYYDIFITIFAVAILVLYIVEKFHSWKLKDELDAVEAGIIELGESYEAEVLDREDTIRNIERDKRHMASWIVDRDDLIEHHAKYCHEIVEDTFELIKFRLRQAHPYEGDVFHEHDSFERCEYHNCDGVVFTTGLRDVYFDDVIPRVVPQAEKTSP